MLSRFSGATVLSLLFVSVVAAQTVRFDTNVGTFDLELNPTGNHNLQSHVDNILAYVNDGRYDKTVINRAASGFVMQMGGFKADSLFLPNAFSDFNSVSSFDPVIVDADGDNLVDFDVSSLLNTPGTVSLALSSSPNTGTSSFFVNLNTNSNLDSNNLRFVPFAVVPDMATIDLIMSLEQANYSDGGLAGDDVPMLPGQRIVFVEQAYVIDESPVTMASMMTSSDASSATATTEPAMLAPAPATAPPLPAFAVPEPSTFALAALALLAATTMKRRKIS